MKHTLLILICFLRAFICLGDNGHISNSFKEINCLQGLSNSAVICVFQDNTGIMWFGTYDGVNSFDGEKTETYRSDFSIPKTLSNNIVHRIQQADSNCLWISNHFGINRFALASKQVVANYEFYGYHTIHSNKNGNTWLVGAENIYYYNTFYGKFIKVKKPNISIGDPNTRCFATDDGELWFFPNQTADLYRFSLNSFDRDSLNTKISAIPSRFHSKPIEYISYQNGIFCFVDIDKDLYIYDIPGKSKIYTRNIASLLNKYGDIGNIIPFNDDIVIGFKTNGIIRLSASLKYKESIIDRNISIFDMYKDPRQGILWIGTDGQGVIMYAKKESLAKNIKTKDISPNLTRQIRSLMTDRDGNLWCGTKGDGLLKIPDYLNNLNMAEAQVFSPSGMQNGRTYTKWEKGFEIFSLTNSHYKKGFWIGTGDTGLCYFSFVDQRLYPVTTPAKIPARHIHSIYEENDSVLWLATSETGVHKVWLDKMAYPTIRIKRQEQLHFFYKQHEIVTFYSMIPEGDSILWLGSREKGLVKYHIKTEKYSVISLKDSLDKAVDDILCLYRSHNGNIYAGTTAGLVCLTIKKNKVTTSYVGREQGLWNDMIHGILEDAKGFLWFSTNKGLIKYNPKNQLSHAYYRSGGIKIEEFSDDAYYQCPYTGKLLFGGIDGLLYMNNKTSSSPTYSPPILLRELTLDGKRVNLSDHYTLDIQSLQISGRSISFSLRIAVPDYLTGEEIEYSYMLESYDRKWSNFSHVSEITYTDIPSGKYNLKIRYKKDVIDTEYKQLTVLVHIAPPWYQTNWAYLIYVLLIVVAGCSLAYLSKKYIKSKRVLREESENKLLPTSNSIFYRQLVDSFTIIYNLSDQLRTEGIPQNQQFQNAEIIRETILSQLLQMNAFPNDGIENIVPISHLLPGDSHLAGISEKILRLLDKNEMNTSVIKSCIPQDFSFPLPKNLVWCILYYCYWYLAKQESVYEVIVETTEEDGKMTLSFSSSALVIHDLYHSLVEKENISKTIKEADEAYLVILFRDLAHSVLKQLGGEVHYTNTKSEQLLTFTFPPSVSAGATGKKRVLLLLENRDEIASLIHILLSEDYEVRQVKSISSAFKQIKEDSPVIFLMDISMYIGEEKEILKYMDKNRLLLRNVLFIPMLTGKIPAAIQHKLFRCADSHITLPYDISYLKDIIYRTLHGKQSTPAIGMQEMAVFSEQIICTTTEQINFMKKFFSVVEQNLDKEELGSTFIAEQMAMSPRQFYRRFKEISDLPPGDLIKNYRIEKAAYQLLNTEAPIHEIIADIGVSSRAYFYKEFSKKYGMTPKDYREQHKSVDLL